MPTKCRALQDLPFCNAGDTVEIKDPHDKYDHHYVIVNGRNINWHKYWKHIWDYFEPVDRQYGDCRGGVSTCHDNAEREGINLYEHFKKYHPTLL